MNSFRKLFVFIGALMLSLSLLAGPVRGQGNGQAQQKEGRPVTVTVVFTPVGKQSFSAAVPRVVEGYASMPIPVSEAGRWIVYVSVGERGFHVEASDPTILLQSANGTSPMTVFSGDFELAYGKPVTVLRTSTYTLEVTLTSE